MTKLHITTEVNFGYKPKDTGLNITDENTEFFASEWDAGRAYEHDQEYPETNIKYYLAGIVKPFTNYTGILMANGKHVTLHYGDTITLPDGLFFEMPVVVAVVGESTSKAGKCLIVEVLIPNHNTITEQI